MGKLLCVPGRNVRDGENFFFKIKSEENRWARKSIDILSVYERSKFWV